MSGSKQSGAHGENLCWHCGRDYIAVADRRERDYFVVEVTRYDNFLAFGSEFSRDYAPMVPDLCVREGGFEPRFEPVGNTLDSVLSMVAAGRGVF